jgi:hypothetical protein
MYCINWNVFVILLNINVKILNGKEEIGKILNILENKFLIINNNNRSLNFSVFWDHFMYPYIIS